MFSTETEKPTMKDLNRYVTRKYASDWLEIGIELGLDLDVLNIIESDNPLKCVACLRNTLDKWLKFYTDATWKTLEIAITNVNRSKLGMNPVDDIYGKMRMYYKDTTETVYISIVIARQNLQCNR